MGGSLPGVAHEHGMFATTCLASRWIMLSMDQTRSTAGLGVASGAALYVGAVLGPGVLLLPALAAQAAGPASVLAWAGLLAASLAIAATFAALGVRHPVAGGAAAYVRAAYGRRAAAVTGWWFYAGVVGGAPAVWLIGGFYVAHLTGGGRAVGGGGGRGDDGRRAWRQRPRPARDRAHAAGPRRAAGRAPARRRDQRAALGARANWTPFAPHGWLAIGTAANLLMLSFVGWEAVAHLAGDFADPRRQLPRAMLAAFAIVAVLYLGLAVTTVARPRRRAGLDRAAGRPHAARPRRRRQRAHRRRRRPAHGRHDERLRRRRHAPGRRAGGRRLDAARDGAARGAAGRHRRGERGHPRRAGRGARRRRPDRARDLDLPSSRSTSPPRRPACGCSTGACARPRRCRWRSWSSCSPSRGPTSPRPRRVALLALAFVSARAGGAAWRGSSAAAGCRAARSLEEAPASRSGG